VAISPDSEGDSDNRGDGMSGSREYAIEDAVDFRHMVKNGIEAQVNYQNTVIKADTVGSVAMFLGINIKKHVILVAQDKRDKFHEYPLLELVLEGLDLAPPSKVYYKYRRVLLADFGDFVIGIAPAI